MAEVLRLLMSVSIFFFLLADGKGIKGLQAKHKMFILAKAALPLCFQILTWFDIGFKRNGKKLFLGTF